MFSTHTNSTLDEIVFFKKNKDYGSYILRKKYDYYLSSSLLFVVMIFTLFISGQFVYNIVSKKNVNNTTLRTITEVLNLSEPPSIDDNLKSQPVDVPKAKSINNNLSTPIVKKDELVADDIFMNADTVGLQNLYSENTLSVEIKYPYGWTYLDQNTKNRLDGVTFWGSVNLFNPPPYIHLEVINKELFIPARYKYKSEFEDYVIYYNDPEELSNHFSRLLYIRTETDVDYTLKLVMKGKEQFETFEPIFFGMVKSFSFGE